ncbi:MAG: Gfo/Idh/MocA family oxidoreductase [Bryobacterales bacterium]|nr:Gfo/Idh/MocA family oxidoreductase [Bryobacterales bacterium]
MSTTRRVFLQASGGVAAAGSQVKTVAANDKVQIALIGAGGMGTGDVQSSLAVGGTHLVAVADVYEGRLTAAKEKWGNHLFTTRDYREVLARKDVDAVIIATPDHWHSRIAVDAMKAGKDVYCEKPMIQQTADGKEMVETEKATKRILQVGSQRVSSIVYKKAQELLKAGAVGGFNMIEAWWDRNSAIGAWQYSIPPDASPANIDWDRFLGRAPKLPFEPMRLFRWRNYKDYGTGVAGDLFVHLFSGMHFITGAIGPTRVYATGGLRFWNDGRDVPDVMLGLFDYPKTDLHPEFTLMLRVNFVDGGGGSHVFRFVGSEGVMTIGNGVTLEKQPRQAEPGYTIDTFPQKVQDQFLAEYRHKYPPVRQTADSIRPRAVEKFSPPPGYDDHRDHHRNFIEAVRTRHAVVEDATFGLRAAGPAVLSNVSYFERRAVQWDPVSMTVQG